MGLELKHTHRHTVTGAQQHMHSTALDVLQTELQQSWLTCRPSPAALKDRYPHRKEHVHDQICDLQSLSSDGRTFCGCQCKARAVNGCLCDLLQAVSGSPGWCDVTAG